MQSSFTMTDHGYMPILLTKRGERIAMRETRAAVKDRLEPMWVVAPPSESKTLDEAAGSAAKELAADWGAREAFVDTLYLGDEATTAGDHPLFHVVTSARAAGVPLIPVTGPDRTPQHLATVARLARLPGPLAGRVCLRLNFADALQLTLPPASRMWSLPDLLVTLGVAPDSVDLILDFGEQTGAPAAAASLAYTLVAALPALPDWRSITFAATNVPASLAGYTQNAITALPRLEWDAYAALTALAPPRLVRFGDYGVQNPDIPLGVDGRFLRIFSQIRYSTDSQWLIARGQELKVHGNGHVAALASLLTAHPDFAGRSFSVGDAWLVDCATGALPSTGSPERWRRVGTSHHLSGVADQVARHSGVPVP